MRSSSEWPGSCRIVQPVAWSIATSTRATLRNSKWSATAETGRLSASSTSMVTRALSGRSAPRQRRGRKAEMGVSEGMLRLSVGLEDPLDVIEDLDQALRAAGL